MNDPFDLARFVAAQDGIYDGALAELASGSKRSHWMWFVFPQIAGLGGSAMARRYALASAAEARAYLCHAVLGARLLECTDAVIANEGGSAEAMLGGVDAIKLRSSMTLFDAVAEGEARFARCLALFFNGHRDEATLRLLAG